MAKKRRAETRQGFVVTTSAFDPETYRRLQLAALEDHAAIAEVVRQAVREWLDRRRRRGRAT